MNQTRLNWCMTLQIHNDGTDKLNIVDVAHESVSRNSTRSNIFGRFVQYFFTVFYCFNLPQNASECISDTLKSQYFPGGGGEPLATPVATLPAGLPTSQISTPKQKNLSTALQGGAFAPLLPTPPF